MRIKELHSVVTKYLQSKLTGVNVIEYHESMFEDSKSFKSFNAPAALVVINQLLPNPNRASPYKAIISFGVVVVPEGNSATDSDMSGWDICEAISKAVYARTFDAKNVRPTEGASVSKSERLSKENEPTGLFYWTVTWEHEFSYDDGI